LPLAYAVRHCSLKIIPRRECSWVLGISTVKELMTIDGDSNKTLEELAAAPAAEDGWR